VPRFVFNLEAVLRQREAAERDRTLTLAQAERARLAAEERLRALQAVIDGERDALRGFLGPGGAAVDLRGAGFQAGAALAVMAEARRAALTLAGAMRRVETERERLAAAVAARKAVANLKERRHQEWLDEQKRREIKALDDIAGGRTARALQESNGEPAHGDAVETV